MKPRIVLMGTGNVATRMGEALRAAGYPIAMVYGRTPATAQELAHRLDTLYTDNVMEVPSDADLYLFAVTDTALPALIEQMPAYGGIWAHTAGSVDAQVFAAKTLRYGVFYPLQTLSKQVPIDFAEVPLLIEANTPEQAAVLRVVAEDISQKVYEVTSSQRATLHLAAVFACNFTNHLYAVASSLLRCKGLPFDLLFPLIDQTAQRIHTVEPHKVQTGPAVRGDEPTMRRHLHLLEDTKLKEIYQLLSEHIQQLKEHSNEPNRL